jgi:hypothetical protein
MQIIKTTDLSVSPTISPEQTQGRGEGLTQCSVDGLTSVTRASEGIDLRTLAPFDTITVRTLNSNYRIFLLDPETGRALVEDDRRFPEPVESRVIGSPAFDHSTFKAGWLGVGLRIEMGVDGKYLLTSPVQSLRVEHQTSAEMAEDISN